MVELTDAERELLAQTFGPDYPGHMGPPVTRATAQTARAYTIEVKLRDGQKSRKVHVEVVDRRKKV